MRWMLVPLRRYADFSGRSRRREFWWFFLFQMVVNTLFIATMVIFVMATKTLFDGAPVSSILVVISLIWVLFIVAMIIPNAAVITRRMHDQGIPGIVGMLLYGATFLLSFLGLAILVFMALDGKKGDNQYGIDPKMNKNVADVFS